MSEKFTDILKAKIQNWLPLHLSLSFGQIKSNVAQIPEMEERFGLLMEELQSHIQHEYFRLNFVPSPVHMLKGLTPDVMLIGEMAFGR